jgi:hypothetical protein
MSSPLRWRRAGTSTFRQSERHGTRRRSPALLGQFFEALSLGLGQRGHRHYGSYDGDEADDRAGIGQPNPWQQAG